MTRQGLHRQVCAFVDRKRAHGWRIEHILFALHGSVVDSSISNELLPSIDTKNARDRAVTDIVRWCVNRYYETQQLP